MASISSPRPRILSGVQPSGKLHIGNYFGAIQQHIALQDRGDAFYFIADYHALTTLRDAERGRSRRRGQEQVHHAPPRAANPRRQRPRRGPRLSGPRPRPGARPPSTANRTFPRSRNWRGFSQPSPEWACSNAPTRTRTRSRRGIDASVGSVHLSGADGRGHLDCPVAPGSGRQGSGAAPGDDPRHGRLLQPGLRRSLPANRKLCMARPRSCQGLTGRR